MAVLLRDRNQFPNNFLRYLEIFRIIDNGAESFILSDSITVAANSFEV